MKTKAIIIATAVALSSCTDFDWNDNHDATLGTFDIVSQSDITANILDDRSNIGEEVEVAWTPCVSSDYSTMFYKIVFSPTGDFENPVYEIETANLSTATSTTISYKDLNIVAERAGIAQDATGTVKWAVRASTGLGSTISESTGTLTVTRPHGFAYNPDYISFNAGDENATVMRKVDDGVFEIFAKLDSQCTMKEISTTVDRTFGISGDALVEGGQITPITPGAFHRIVIDFNESTASIRAIEQVGLWYSGANDVVATMKADGDMPVWSCDWHFEPVDNDYRYKFQLKEKGADGSVEDVFYGYASRTATNQTASSPATYFKMVLEDGVSQSNYCYKFGNRTYQLNKDLRITADFSADIEYYTHTVTELN